MTSKREWLIGKQDKHVSLAQKKINAMKESWQLNSVGNGGYPYVVSEVIFKPDQTYIDNIFRDTKSSPTPLSVFILNSENVIAVEKAAREKAATFLNISHIEPQPCTSIIALLINLYMKYGVDQYNPNPVPEGTRLLMEATKIVAERLVSSYTRRTMYQNVVLKRTPRPVPYGIYESIQVAKSRVLKI